MKEIEEVKQVIPEEEPPPILKSWKQVYGIVAFNLIFLIIIFYLFTEYFK